MTCDRVRGMSVPAQGALFDKSDEYEEMLAQGLRLSGEDRHYFIAGRLGAMRDWLGPGFRPRAILDFGCGIGDTVVRLAELYPDAEITGVDAAEPAVEHARRAHGGARIRFESLAEFRPKGSYDLCYSNGVFHHIAPSERVRAAGLVRDALAPRGRFALMENNPWNPGTRMVMRRIPFDRDAIPLAPPESRSLLASAGFECAPARFLFFFPRALAWLRASEPWLARIPFGAQYCVLATRV
jgi:SAM-dependent methyltransferase